MVKKIVFLNLSRVFFVLTLLFLLIFWVNINSYTKVNARVIEVNKDNPVSTGKIGSSQYYAEHGYPLVSYKNADGEEFTDYLIFAKGMSVSDIKAMQFGDECVAYMQKSSNMLTIPEFRIFLYATILMLVLFIVFFMLNRKSVPGYTEFMNEVKKAKFFSCVELASFLVINITYGFIVIVPFYLSYIIIKTSGGFLNFNNAEVFCSYLVIIAILLILVIVNRSAKAIYYALRKDGRLK